MRIYDSQKNLISAFAYFEQKSETKASKVVVLAVLLVLVSVLNYAVHRVKLLTFLHTEVLIFLYCTPPLTFPNQIHVVTYMAATVH